MLGVCIIKLNDIPTINGLEHPPASRISQLDQRICVRSAHAHMTSQLPLFGESRRLVADHEALFLLSSSNIYAKPEKKQARRCYMCQKLEYAFE